MFETTENPLKLALDLTNISSGGSISILLRLMAHWCAQHLQLVVFYSRDTVVNEIQSAGLPVSLVKIGHNWPAWRIFLYRNLFLGRKIKAYQPDILYCVNSMLLWCSIPQVVHIRNLQHFSSKSIFKQLVTSGPYEALRDWICRYSVRRNRYCVYVSNFISQKAISVCNLTEYHDQIVIYNPISKRLLQLNEACADPLRNYSNNIILGVFNDYPHKDLPTFLRTLAHLRSMHPERNWRGLVLGEGQWEKYKPLLEELKLSECMEFPGYVSSNVIDQYYKKAFCLLVTSHLESFNNTPLEAMACSCPVVITNCCAHPEVAGEAALFFQPGDDSTAARIIDSLLNDKNSYAQLVTQGKQNLTRFLPEHSAKLFLDYFEKIKNRKDL